jgi:hypothetical protein
MPTPVLDSQLLARMHAYWRAANYLSVGQIYLYDNPLLRRPLLASDVKPLVVGHWGTTPGQNFIYVHLNRVIKQYDLNMFYVAGPGHGGPALVANTYLEGTYSEIYPDISQDAAGLKRMFKQFSFPGGISSHVAPTTPGSIHEGGELGYSLSHAFGAVFDNPSLIVACVVGDGEAETGPLATAWQSTKFMNPLYRDRLRVSRRCRGTPKRFPKSSTAPQRRFPPWFAATSLSCCFRRALIARQRECQPTRRDAAGGGKYRRHALAAHRPVSPHASGLPR